MYYFNGHDRRLERTLQTAVMIFEAFAGFEHKYRYAMVGHSGDTPCKPLVEYGCAHANRLSLSHDHHASRLSIT